MRADISILKQHLEEKFPGVWAAAHERQKIIPTGISAIDYKFRGLVRGRISFWSGPISSGKTTLLRKAISNWCNSGLHVAYIDSQHQLLASDWAYLDTCPGRFWVVRPPNENETPSLTNWATDCLIRSHAFDVVVLDLAGFPLPTSRTYARLQRSLAKSKTALVIIKNNEIYETKVRAGESRRGGVRSRSAWTRGGSEACRADGAHTNDYCLHFRLNGKSEFAEGLSGTIAILPVVSASLSKDGISQNEEIAISKDGKSYVTNCLFTHPQVPDRRASKA